jgi:hypothetical protein
MAPWLALTTDGMLLAALAVIWVRRHRGDTSKPARGPRSGPGWRRLPQISPRPSRPRWGLSSRCGHRSASRSPWSWLRSSRTRPNSTRPSEALGPPSGPVPCPTMPNRLPGMRGLRLLAKIGRPGHARRDTALGTARAPATGTWRASCPLNPQPRPRAGTNGHGHVPTSPAPDLRDVLDPGGRVPVSASGHGPGMEPEHEAGHDGRHGRVRAGCVSDGDILGWLREQACASGRVPGRRKLIDRWRLVSTRAERLRRIVLDEAAHNAAASAG